MHFHDRAWKRERFLPLVEMTKSGIFRSDTIDFQIIHFTRPEGGRRISYTSTTDKAVK